MPIHALSNQTLQEPVCKSQTNNLSFRASSVNNLEKTPAEDTFEKPKKRTGLWVALGVISAAGIAIGVDFWKFEGKHCKDLWGKVRNVFNKEAESTAVSGTNSGNNQSSSNIVENTIEKFREKGKFDKGKALLNDGSTYSGNIVVNRKDGSKILLEYKNGVIQKSTKSNGSAIDWQKTWEYLDNDSHKILDKDGEEIFRKTFFSDENMTQTISHERKEHKGCSMLYDNSNKRIAKKDGLDYIYTDGGVLKSLKGGPYVNTIFYPDGKTVRCKAVRKGREIAQYQFYNNGEVEAIISPNTIIYPQKKLYVRHEVVCNPPHELADEVFGYPTSKTLTNFCSYENGMILTGEMTAQTLRYKKGAKDIYLSFKHPNISFELFPQDKNIINITRNGCQAKYNIKTDKIEVITGDWTEEDLRQIISEYKTKTKEYISQYRTAHRDYLKYTNEIEKYGDIMKY